MGCRLRDKVAIVIGAGSIAPGWGNGKAAAVLFARQGAKVLCVDCDAGAAQETRDIIRAEGGVAESWKTDISDSNSVRSMVEVCKERFGQIDILHNNVGINIVGGPVEQTEEDWDRIVDIDLKGAFLACKHVLPVMEGQGRGTIINISSIASIRWIGVPYIAYASSKAGLNQLTRSVAAQYAPKGIRCNSILVGMMRTPVIEKVLTDAYGGNVDEMIRKRDAQCPMGHMGDAWDIAYAALFLASDEAKYITGIELVVDGGVTLRSALNN